MEEKEFKPIIEKLYWAIRDNEHNKVRELLTQYPQLINAPIDIYYKELGGNKGKTPLLLALAFSDVDMFKMILEEFQADPNQGDFRDSSALFRLSSDHKIDKKELIDILFEKGVDVNKPTSSGKTPLMLAAQFGYADQVKKLLEHGADATLKDRNNKNVFNWMAQYNGNEENEEEIEKIVKMLVDAGADINNVDDFGNTALNKAIEYKKFRVR